MAVFVGEVNQLTTIRGFDLFISYSMDPDYQLSRRVENFLEGFHKVKLSSDVQLKPLQVCRDGSDFSLHKIKKEAPDDKQHFDFVQQVLIDYLSKSKFLLLLCSKNASRSKYVNFEVNWFIQNKGLDKVLLAVTEGEDLAGSTEQVFPLPVLTNKLQTAIYYDFRGFKKEAKRWIKVRQFEE